MTDSASTATPVAGYYPDPAGGPHRRWWDGTAWTDHLEQAAPMPADAYGRPIQPPIPADTNVNTVWSWLIVTVPFAYAALFLALFDFGGMMTRAMEHPKEPGLPFSPAFFALVPLSWALTGLLGLFAWLDYRALKAKGIVRPFHWAWVFLQIAYIIGRGVVLKRRVGRGFGPTKLYIILYVAYFVISMTYMLWIIATATEKALHHVPVS